MLEEPDLEPEQPGLELELEPGLEEPHLDRSRLLHRVDRAGVQTACVTRTVNGTGQNDAASCLGWANLRL